MDKAMTAAEVEALRKQLATDRTVMVDIMDHLKQLVLVAGENSPQATNEESYAA
ncbi:hypothetical protein ACFSJ3_14790 [Corallincola platygyrae]|uniref:Uncharacterized protein n=1 Tax=Corallincola platygyrae TaxID=1193278 RepID=A0ABW4XNV7_9GAMM